MADISIRANATGAAPRDYTIPGAQEILPKSVTASLDLTGAAGPAFPCLQVLDPGGNVMVSAVGTQAVAAGASADVSWFPHLAPASVASAAEGVVVETLFVASNTSTPVTSATTLQSGRQYVLTAQGTYSDRNDALPFGNPQANAMFPTSTVGRVSTQVGIDPECTFAADAPFTPAHTGAFVMDLGDGMGQRHIEPVGGPFSTPQTNFFYTYQVTGAGSTVAFQILDSVYTDNYGKLLVTIQTVGGGSSGGGGGSLLPDPSQQSDGSWLRTSAGVAVWRATPQVTEADMSLSDVTTQNVSTSKHGFAPKAPNDATKYLDGTGSYTVPTGTGGALTLIASSTLGADQASFDTNTILGGNIPGTYTHLIVEMSLRSDYAGGTFDFAVLYFNNDTTAANYFSQRLDGSGASASAVTFSATGGTVVGQCPTTGAGGIANSFGAFTVHVHSYANTSVNKATLSDSGMFYAASSPNRQANYGAWFSTAAVTRITVVPGNGSNWKTHSVFSLYGVS